MFNEVTCNEHMQSKGKQTTDQIAYNSEATTNNNELVHLV